MKKLLPLVAIAGVIAAGTAAFGATIVGSDHDLSVYTTPGTSTQICIYCHAPHMAKESLPLWNRTNPDPLAFTLYSGVGMANVSFKTGFTSDSTSLFCMSCHDGQTQMDAIHNAGAIEGTSVVGRVNKLPLGSGVFAVGALSATNAANLTFDLSKTHPINFPVSESDTQTDLNVAPGESYMGPISAASGLASNVTFPLFKSTASGGQSNTRNSINRSLECGSCHAVHDSQYSPFLRDTMDKSQLCLGCHNK